MNASEKKKYWKSLLDDITDEGMDKLNAFESQFVYDMHEKVDSGFFWLTKKQEETLEDIHDKVTE